MQAKTGAGQKYPQKSPMRPSTTPTKKMQGYDPVLRNKKSAAKITQIKQEPQKELATEEENKNEISAQDMFEAATGESLNIEIQTVGNS